MTRYYFVPFQRRRQQSSIFAAVSGNPKTRLYHAFVSVSVRARIFLCVYLREKSVCARDTLLVVSYRSIPLIRNDYFRSDELALTVESFSLIWKL